MRPTPSLLPRATCSTCTASCTRRSTRRCAGAWRPATSRTPSTPPARRAERPVLSEEQADQLLDALRDDRLYSPHFLALDTGLREGDLVARRWTDLDEGSRTLLVQTKFERETGLGIVEGPTKARRPRSSVPVSEHALRVLRVHAGHPAEEKRHAGSAYQDDGLIWCWEDGARYVPNWISGHFRRLRKRLGWLKPMPLQRPAPRWLSPRVSRSRSPRSGWATPVWPPPWPCTGTPRRRCTARRPTGAAGCWAPGTSRRRPGGGIGAADEHYGAMMGKEARTAPGFPWRRSRNPLWRLACKWCALEDLNPRPSDP